MAESLMGRFEVIHSTHWSYSECIEAFNYSLEEYLLFGGYPGSNHLRNDESRWRDYMRNSIVEPTISSDVLQMQAIRKPALMRALFLLGASYSGQELAYTKLQGQLQDAGNTTTLAHYLDLLGKANILTGLEKYSSEGLRQRRSTPRFMVYDISLMVYANDTTFERLAYDKVHKGHITESAVGAYLLARSLVDGFDVFYWRDRDTEVDFVIRKGSALTAIEVKSGRIRGVGGSLEFMRRYPHALSYVVGDASTPLEGFLAGEFPLFKTSYV
jgi:predicted AAA+ superfamily ATPase